MKAFPGVASFLIACTALAMLLIAPGMASVTSSFIGILFGGIGLWVGRGSRSAAWVTGAIGFSFSSLVYCVSVAVLLYTLK